MCYICLFWEKTSMRRMILMNLNSHRHRNKMTSIIYSISLGFLIFLVVAYNLELQVLQLTKSIQMGAAFKIKCINDCKEIYLPEYIDPILRQN